MGTMTWPEVAHRLVQVGPGTDTADVRSGCCWHHRSLACCIGMVGRSRAMHADSVAPCPTRLQVQRTHRLCAARDLTEHDIVARIMRRENYLIGMLNKVGCV